MLHYGITNAVGSIEMRVDRNESEDLEVVKSLHCLFKMNGVENEMHQVHDNGLVKQKPAI
jgi:hypothetical protein